MTTRSKILSLIIGLFPLVYSFGQSSFQKVKVTNLENVKGTLYIGWYNKAVDFRINDKAIYRAETEVKNQDEVTVTFKDIPEGKYAIAVFIDENGDYKLEKNFFGIPTEKYGFSNNVLPKFRAATFEESSFVLGKEQTTVNIKVK